MWSFQNKTQNEKIIIYAIMIAIIIIVVYMLINNNNKSDMTKLREHNISRRQERMLENKLESLIDPLEKQGWVVYLSRSCPYCVRQVDMLNKEFPNFHNKHYDVPTDVVPKWVNTITGEVKPGMQSLDILKHMAKL